MGPHQSLRYRASLNGYFGSERPGSGGRLVNMIQDQILDRMRSSAWGDDEDEGFFLPKHALREILTDERVRDLLWERPETALIKLSDISGPFKRTEMLATLLLIPCGIRHIDVFIKRRLCDNNLPITRKLLRSYFPSEVGLSVPDSFFQYQYWIHVPTWVFSSYEIDFAHYDRRYVFPFTESKVLSRGGQGTVWKVRIHGDHYSSKACTVSKEP